MWNVLQIYPFLDHISLVVFLLKFIRKKMTIIIIGLQVFLQFLGELYLDIS